MALFVGLSVYFGFYRKEMPGIAVVGIAFALLIIGGLKLWLLSYIGRRLSEDRWIERAVDLGFDVSLLAIVMLVFVWIGRMGG